MSDDRRDKALERIALAVENLKTVTEDATGTYLQMNSNLGDVVAQLRSIDNNLTGLLREVVNQLSGIKTAIQNK
ncbi:MAG: hypothetical protein FJX46_11925 [Alphaproteobacteria bacterium]|nr:hypothetical protein [Alphaproteobacteria bacterium]